MAASPSQTGHTLEELSKTIHRSFSPTEYNLPSSEVCSQESFSTGEPDRASPRPVFNTFVEVSVVFVIVPHTTRSKLSKATRRHPSYTHPPRHL